MSKILKKISVIFRACRGYSVPISIMSWLVPFIFGLFNSGNICYGIVALFGIVILHMATNLFDDAIDYTIEKIKIDKGLKTDFNFQSGKCITIFDGSLSLNQTYIISISMFLFVLLIGLFFMFVYGFELLYVVIPAAILCVLYPILGSMGFGELIVSVVFSPLIYLGVYYVMTGNYSFNILILSISTGFLTIAVLHNHMLLDYSFDSKNSKITLCRLCKNQKNAYLLLVVFVILAYLNILFFIIKGNLLYSYLLVLFSIPSAYVYLKVMKNHVENPKIPIKYNILMGNMNPVKNVPIEQKDFITKFLLPQNLLTLFTILLCISIVLENIF